MTYCLIFLQRFSKLYWEFFLLNFDPLRPKVPTRFFFLPEKMLLKKIKALQGRTGKSRDREISRSAGRIIELWGPLGPAS